MILKSSSIPLIFRLRQTAKDQFEIRMGHGVHEDLRIPPLAEQSNRRARGSALLGSGLLLFPIKIAFSGSAGEIRIRIRQGTAPDENSPHGLYFHHSCAIQAFEGTPEITEGLMIHIHFLAAQKAPYFHRSILPNTPPSFRALLVRTQALLGRCFENHSL